MKNINEFIKTNITVSFIVLTILAIIIGAILQYYFFERLFYLISKKPKIVLNFTEMRPLGEQKSLKNFKLLFSTFNNKAFLIAVQIDEEDLNKLYGEVPIPTKLIPCDNCIESFISLKNIGKVDAKNISINLTSLSNIQVVEKDPKLSLISCGGILDNRGCYFEINRLIKNEKILFSVATKEPGVRNINCAINGHNDQCLINLRHYYIQQISGSNTIFKMDNKKIFLPSLNSDSNIKRFFYQQTEDKWIEF